MLPVKQSVRTNPSQTLVKKEINDLILFESFDNDPYFEILPEIGLVKAGWYIIKFEFELLKGEILLPKIYFDFGNGFSEEYHWRLFYSNKTIFGLVKVPWDSHRLRLDISEKNIEFEIKEFSFTKVNKAHAALQFFSLLDTLGESRRKFLKALLTQKSFKGHKKLLRSLFEGNYIHLDYQKIPEPIVEKSPTASKINFTEILKHSSINKEKFQQFLKTTAKLNQLSKKIPGTSSKPVDIILPVYNGIEYLEKLLPQLVERSDLPFILTIIDDCSPDKRILPFLNSFKKKYQNINVKQNEVNLGFTKTVNRLLKSCSNDIVVLLNSDIEVPSNWLSKLIAPILNDEKIATVTPLSNCATICSFPNVGDNPLLENYDVEKINAPLRNLNLFYEEVPTGVGFCMAINRKMTQKVGILNEEAFPRGYGEEVDLCFRARKNGYKNVLNASLFVYHKHGGSFTSSEKIKLLNENQRKLERFHPEFNSVLQNYFQKNTFVIFKLIYFLRLLNQENKKITLFLDHDLGGGTNVYSKNYFAENNNQVFLYGQYINPNNNSNNQILFSVKYLNYDFKFGLNDIQVLFDLLAQFNITLNEVVINHLVSYKDSLKLSQKLVNFKKQHGVRLKVLCHDFYFICPNFLLFKDNKESCGIPTDLKVCNKCLSKLGEIIDPKLIPNDFTSLIEWRKNWGELLVNQADELVMFSDSTKKLFTKLWPELADKAIVRPHSLKGFTKYSDKVYRIGILGSLHSVAKGAKFMQDLAGYIEENKLDKFKLINFGGIHPNYDHPLIEKTGSYTLDDLHYKLIKNKVDLILIPSIWDETFSFTTREAIETGLPTACFKLGGQYDQVKNYENGIVVEEISAQALLKAIDNYFEK